MNLELFQLICLGVAVGFTSALLGIGGGVLIVPLLPLISDLNQKAVIATSLFTICIVVIANTFGFHRKKLVDWKVATSIGLIASGFAFCAGHVTLRLSDELLKSILAICLMLFSVRLFIGSANKSKHQISTERQRVWLTYLSLGGIGGFVAGMTGIGAGVILSPALIHFNVVDNERVSPTSNGTMVFTTIFGGIPFFMNHLSLSSSDSVLVGFKIKSAVILALSGIIVAHFVRPHQQKLPAHLRKNILGGLLLLFSLKEAYVLIMN